MTATDKEIVEEARKRRHAAGYGPGANLGLPPLDHYIIEVVREGWTPPDVAGPVDIDTMAKRLVELVERVTENSKQKVVTGVNAHEMLNARIILDNYARGNG